MADRKVYNRTAVDKAATKKKKRKSTTPAPKAAPETSEG